MTNDDCYESWRRAAGEANDLGAAMGDILYITDNWLTPSDGEKIAAIRARAKEALGRLDYKPVALSKAVRELVRDENWA